MGADPFLCLLQPYAGLLGSGPLFHGLDLAIGGGEDGGGVRLDDGVHGRVVDRFGSVWRRRLGFEHVVWWQLLAAGGAEGRRFGCGHGGFLSVVMARLFVRGEGLGGRAFGFAHDGPVEAGVVIGWPPVGAGGGIECRRQAELRDVGCAGVGQHGCRAFPGGEGRHGDPPRSGLECDRDAIGEVVAGAGIVNDEFAFVEEFAIGAECRFNVGSQDLQQFGFGQ